MIDIQAVSAFGKIAGIGGLSIGLILLIFRDVIRKKIFSKLSPGQGYRLLRLILILTWSVALIGIVAWAYAKGPYSRQDASFIAVLHARGDAISGDFDQIITALNESNVTNDLKPKVRLAVNRLRASRSQFRGLHTKHLAAVRAGDLALAHELSREIYELLSTVDKTTTSVEAEIRKDLGPSPLSRQYHAAPEPGVDRDYDKIRETLNMLHEGTGAVAHSMRYPGDPPTDAPPVVRQWFSSDSTSVHSADSLVHG